MAGRKTEVFRLGTGDAKRERHILSPGRSGNEREDVDQRDNCVCQWGGHRIYILRTAVESWWSVVLFIVLASGIAMVVDGASNGTLRLAMALDEAFCRAKA